MVDSHIVLHVPDGAALTLAQRELIALDKRAEEAAEAAVPNNTRRAYEFELKCFVSWCARHGVKPIPAEPRLVRAYLRELADQGRSAEDLPTGKPKGAFGYSALMRALAAICTSNVASGHATIWNNTIIVEARRAFGKEKGTAPKKKKSALGSDGALLFQACDLMDERTEQQAGVVGATDRKIAQQATDNLRRIRDRALILVGWHGGKRRSEIVAARVEHFERTEKGNLRWTIPRSKTDQMGKGLTILLPLGRDERYCPVRAYQKWLTASRIDHGYVFRGIDMLTGAVMNDPLGSDGVARRIQHYAKKLGLNPKDFGGHSLRSGFITTARRAGKSVEDIMDVTGHHDPRTLFGYIRQIDLEESSAAKGLLDGHLARVPRDIDDPEALLALLPEEPKPAKPKKKAPVKWFI